MKLVCLLIIYRLTLDWLYGNWISLYYSWYGFNGQWDVISFIKSLVFLFIGTKLMKLKTNASSIVIYFIYLFYFVPFTSMIAFDAFNNITYEFLYMIYWLILVSGHRLFLKSQYDNLSFNITENYIPKYRIAFYVIMLMLCLNIVYIIIFFTGINLKLDLYEIYNIRKYLSQIKLPVISSYLLTSAQICIPIGIFYFMQMKKYLYVAVLFFISILLFISLAFKSTIFIILVSAIIIFLKFEYNQKNILSGLCLLNILSILEYIILDKYIIVELIIRRALFWPNLLSFQYYNYFNLHQPDYFASSFLRWFGVSSEFSKTRIVNIIGQTYYGYDMPANNGLLADAFANLGNIGIIIMPILILIVLKLLDINTSQLKSSLLMVPCFIIAIDFINTFLSVALLTHGVLLAILLFRCINCQYKRNNKYIE